MRILLVEDDARIARFVSKGLRENSFAVDVAATGEAALYQAEIYDYDLVILDVMIPAPDGFAVCRRLRENKMRAPVLMLTARDAVEDRIKGLNLGADDYLTKPFDFGELLARLRALLRRRGAGDLIESKIRIADLEIDAQERRVWRAGAEIVLTAKEFALLEFLARSAGRVVGREEISARVWDENFDPFSNLIEVYINRLRRKIDAPEAVALLHTRRGAGYVLQDFSNEAKSDV